MQKIDLDTRVIRNPDLVFTDMDGETVMMSIDQGEYYGINDVGSRVWVLLEGPVSITALCDAILAEYEVDQATCRADMLRFVGRLLELGVVVRC